MVPLLTLTLAPLASAAELDCPATVGELPPSPLFQPTDQRFVSKPVVVVLKEARRGMVFVDGKLATVQGGPACWSVGLGSGYPPGHKVRLGDRRTPEGWYRLSDRPWSAFPYALTVSYPGPEDARRGLRDGLITQAQHAAIVAAARADRPPPMETKLGGRILLHGGGRSSDWTLGCVAFDDPDIALLRTLLPPDLKADVLILP